MIHYNTLLSARKNEIWQHYISPYTIISTLYILIINCYYPFIEGQDRLNHNFIIGWETGRGSSNITKYTIRYTHFHNRKYFNATQPRYIGSTRSRRASSGNRKFREYNKIFLQKITLTLKTLNMNHIYIR